MNVRYLATNLLNLFVGIVEVFLALRFVLKLFGANPDASFVSWVYDMTNVLLEPFRGVFTSKVLENQYVLEFTTLFAMLMYAILALVLVALVNLVAGGPATTVVAKKRR